MKFTNILVPFDKSEHALEALSIAKGLAEEDPSITLNVIDVLYISEFSPAIGLDANPYEGIPEPIIDPATYDKLVEGARAREKAAMEQAMGTMLDGLPNNVTIAVLNEPSVVDGINKYAREHGCDLIVMGSRGLGVLRGMLGSVSYGVLRSAEIPVLVTKGVEESK